MQNINKYLEMADEQQYNHDHRTMTTLLKDHDHRRRVGACTRADNTCVEQFLNYFLNFIFLGKGVTIGMDIGRKASWDTGNGMTMNTTGRRESPGSGKTI
jgi:hypothetical protein